MTEQPELKVLEGIHVVRLMMPCGACRATNNLYLHRGTGAVSWHRHRGESAFEIKIGFALAPAEHLDGDFYRVQCVLIGAARFLTTDIFE